MKQLTFNFIVLSTCITLSTSVLAARSPLKVCNAENEMPYANKNGEGFENKIAQLIGDELNRKVEYVHWNDPRYLVRDYLDKGKCDVVIGLDTGDPRVLTTSPYYRSGYVFITQANARLNLSDWKSEALQKSARIAFIPGTPAEVMMKAIGRYHDQFNYMHELVGFKSRRNQYIKYDPAKLVAEVESGKAEIAVLWGPSAARYVKAASTPLAMTIIPDNSVRADGEKMPFHYSTSMAVRKGETQLLTELNQAIKNRKQEITQILEAEGIPLVPENNPALASN
ncbi:MAG: methanol oxidation system protein MoxJ [Gammaproteobacteria bacterium HGW-Gammaproteobacteria-3]|nr:MAG: methanol oxidation system protein MoxJ [Gammaproteobacteria bacterium HGW-Gammaproteobacteria-3]